MTHEHGPRPTRVPVEGSVRLLVQSPSGFLIGSGEIIDLSPGGCAIRVNNRAIEAGLKGRIDVTVGGEALSLPIVTRWVRAGGDTRLVGCAFDDPTVENLRTIHALINERSGFFI